jgi:hypothetical protein
LTFQKRPNNRNEYLHYGISSIVEVAEMRKKAVLTIAIDETSKKIFDYLFMCKSRKKPEYFSRKGKLGFMNLVAFTLNFIKKTVQTELDSFFNLINSDVSITKQAFSQARQKISHEPFKDLFELTAELAYQCEDMTTFKGMRVFAIDGTSIAVENTSELVEFFGCSGARTTSATARGSVLYDVLNEAVLDAHIGKYSVGERAVASQHIIRLKELGISNNLIIFDRGYASADLISQLYETGTHFLMRVRRKFNKEIDQMPLSEGFVNIEYKAKVYLLRVIKFSLPSGETETLITDLTVDVAKTEDFPKLYFLRWPIETRYDIIKTKLQLENFTGKTVLSVFQDFYASMYLSNIASFAKYITDADIKKENEDKNLKYEYVTNTNILIGKLKDKLILAILEPSRRKRQRAVQKVLSEATRSRIPIRPGRQFERKLPRKKRFHMRNKSAL